ncbi:DUF1330 domain-containing protein [Porticoccaceae bacterium]|nr:DUF1330 domain-containing protein [Porticoccaceae bacterium]
MASINPSREQFQAFKALPRDKPVDMLNLVRLREVADYADLSEVSGADAFARYAELSAVIFQRVGGEIGWRGSPSCVVIGSSEQQWDMAFIARYPSADAFLALATDADYLTAVKHRQAAVADSLLIRCNSLPVGGQFG